MDDKKNVSFVSGLALILSALSLLLIGIQQITATPYTDTMEEVIETKLQALESRVDMKVDAGLKKLEKAEDNAALREMKTFQNNLNAWLAAGSENPYTDKVNAIKAQIENLVKEMESAKGGAPAVVTAQPAPAKAAEPAKDKPKDDKVKDEKAKDAKPAEPAKDKPKDEAKKEEPKKDAPKK
jgi:hypothetical protein